MTQYVALRFSGNTKTYTYVWEGREIAPGDRVEVLTRDGPATFTAETVSAEWPAALPRDIKLKPILRIVEKAAP